MPGPIEEAVGRPLAICDLCTMSAMFELCLTAVATGEAITCRLLCIHHARSMGFDVGGEDV